MMRVIEAEERLGTIVDRAYATGNMERADGFRHRRRLEQSMRGGARVKAAKGHPAAIASMGIAVIAPIAEPSEKARSDV